MKRDFDCDTCSWFEDGRCTNFNRSAYYPCPEWLRRFDPEKYICDQEWIDTVGRGVKCQATSPTSNGGKIIMKHGKSKRQDITNNLKQERITAIRDTQHGKTI